MVHYGLAKGGRATARSGVGRSRVKLYDARRALKEVSMIAVGEKAPGFSLTDQFSRTVTLDQFKGRRHVMLLFYPLDFTPT